MNLSNTIIQLENIGVSLTVVEGNIKAHIPDTIQQAHPEVEDLLTELKAHKQEAIKILTYTDTFFDNYTYDPNMDLGKLAANDSFFNELFKSWYERRFKRTPYV